MLMTKIENRLFLCGTMIMIRKYDHLIICNHAFWYLIRMSFCCIGNSWFLG